ncbi:hypothetical protein P9222_01080 [Paenibacillus amylolyticus]|nr:hypothetical protein [Paenibacillus amylolyticus]WFR63070.1 hypothetical protein P9222_01080 [Paenibacillus amylolyticus]
MVRIHALSPLDERQKEMRLVAAPLFLADVMMDEMIDLADGTLKHSLAPERLRIPAVFSTTAAVRIRQRTFTSFFLYGITSKITFRISNELQKRYIILGWCFYDLIRSFSPK